MNSRRLMQSPDGSTNGRIRHCRPEQYYSQQMNDRPPLIHFRLRRLFLDDLRLQTSFFRSECAVLAAPFIALSCRWRSIFRSICAFVARPNRAFAGLSCQCAPVQNILFGGVGAVRGAQNRVRGAIGVIVERAPVANAVRWRMVGSRMEAPGSIFLGAFC